MKKNAYGALVIITVCSYVPAAFPVEGAEKKSGEAMFKEHCAVCHPDGGNIVTPNKTLKKKNLAANGIKTEADIIKTMRKPGPGMNKFDEKTIPDSEAAEIAKYILKTLK